LSWEEIKKDPIPWSPEFVCCKWHKIIRVRHYMFHSMYFHFDESMISKL
jgi:hypothetical protein